MNSNEQMHYKPSKISSLTAIIVVTIAKKIIAAIVSMTTHVFTIVLLS